MRRATLAPIIANVVTYNMLKVGSDIYVMLVKRFRVTVDQNAYEGLVRTVSVARGGML